jgi:hypothetical protein
MVEFADLGKRLVAAPGTAIVELDENECLSYVRAYVSPQ